MQGTKTFFKKNGRKSHICTGEEVSVIYNDKRWLEEFNSKRTVKAKGLQ